MLKLLTDDHAQRQRLDQWLAQQLAPRLSRNRLQNLIRKGMLTVNGKQITEPRFKLSRDLEIEINLPPAIKAEPCGEDIPLDILYEDNDIIVLNKPAGLVVHPGHGNWTGTLVNALIHHCGHSLSGIGGVKRPGIVHRLDKNTTGVMIAAKNDHAHYHLSRQFADHGRCGTLKRIYTALVWGLPARRNSTIDLPLARSHRDKTRQAIASTIRADARHAITHYTVMEKFGENDDATALASLIECQLETGRTHQIRVHMAHIHHPLIGDKDYGSVFKTKANCLEEPLKTIVRSFPRQALHAQSLTFEHPSTNKIMIFRTVLPNDMEKLVDAFRKKTNIRVKRTNLFR
ncbi:MAG: 23S rRNA pseudouridine synthase [Candidatus Tokpelaia sp. JSC189]|nr:MAG: 23S rRNA pseudouridine synthase [Candidatus Tokpelaia sp. JSC189]